MNSPEHVFRVDSGSPALDLLNTLDFEGEARVDRIHAPADLLAWLDATGLGHAPGPMSPALRSPPGARILLGEARSLRDDLGALFEAHRAGARVPPHLLYGLNRVLEAGPTSARVRIEADGIRLEGQEAGEGPLAVLAPVARDAARLLTEVDPDRIRRCAAEDCRRWFIDTSKGGRRRWCSMATCGNRAKAARHRRRVETG